MTEIGLLGAAILVATLAFHLWRGVFYDGFETWMSFSFLTLFAIIGLYIYDYARMPADTRQYFLPIEDYSALLFFAAAFVVTVTLAEYVGKILAVRAKHYQQGRLPDPIFLQLAVVLFVIGALGMVAVIASSGGFVNKYSAVHGAATNFSSAYIYQLPQSLFTACFIFQFYRLTRGNLKKYMLVLLILGMAFLFFDAFTQGKRGNTIRFALLALLPYVISGALTRSKKIIAMVLVVVAILFLNFLPYLRQATSLATIGNLSQMVSSLSELSDKSTEATVRLALEGKHVVFAANTLAGAIEANAPNYGARWIFPFINLVPRAVWPDKPSRYDMGATTYDMLAVSSGIVIPSGSHTGGMVESFIEWGYFVGFFWFGFGAVGGYLRRRTHQTRDLLSATLLFGYYSAYVQFVLQDTVAGILFMLFVIGPFVACYKLLQIMPRRTVRSAIIRT